MFSFSHIVGQEQLKENLIKISKADKVPHSYLFGGKMGYGTFGIAMAYLRYLYCENKSESDSCGECNMCKKVEEFQHPDIHFILPSFTTKELSANLMESFKGFVKENGVYFDNKDWMKFNQKENSKIRSAEINNILHNANISSYLGGYTTIFIWNFESIGKEQNKLLKILEEPPKKVRFILVSENINSILPTVISRCSIQKTTRLNNKELMTYLKSQNINISDENEVAVCQGDILQAKNYFSEENLAIDIDELLLKYLKGFINFNQRKITNIKNTLEVNEILVNEKKIFCKNFLEYQLSFLRQIIMYQHTGQINVSPKLEKALLYFADNLELDQLSVWIEYVETTLNNLEGNINLKINFLSLAIKVGQIQDRLEFEKIADKEYNI